MCEGVSNGLDPLPESTDVRPHFRLGVSLKYVD